MELFSSAGGIGGSSDFVNETIKGGLKG